MISRELVTAFFDELPVSIRVTIERRVEAATSRRLYELSPKETFSAIESALGKHISDLLLTMFLNWLKKRGIYATPDDVYRDVLN